MINVTKVQRWASTNVPSGVIHKVADYYDASGRAVTVCGKSISLGRRGSGGGWYSAHDSQEATCKGCTQDGRFP